MKNCPKVSIVIPVFNVANFLDISIGSAIDQSYPNIEVIIVNDGSTDESAEIIKNLISNVPFARLYNQENQGLSAARNYGLSKATGDFIIFLDSDDQIRKNAISLLINKINSDKTNVVFFNYSFYNINSETTVKGPVINERLEGISDSKLVLRSLLRGQIEHHAWGFIAKKNIYLDNGIEFPVGRFYEDISTTYKIIISQFSNNISILHSPILYFYSVRKDSIINTKSLNHIRDILLGAQEIIDTLKNESAFQTDLQIFSEHIIKWVTVLSSRLENKKDRKIAMQNIMLFSNINELKIFGMKSEKKSLVDFIYKLFGVRGVYFTYRLKEILL
ncbi:glycosyltransferase family 2 protein [Weissella paramesenteroides]|uniref:glycosyltransferase family 2 protein n=1 Tax=Weissella paramesenteroides TaxID=1249 RepID=UPI00223BFDF0|nr:glycosyltransferase family 2 protein [Weissella paramesenteroides]MCS9984080.1 glycosyltransferase family 2 protein [Weissella paramesenteroides]MCS9998550.1 glycosyltransferase family 2 protein [Weissella paramesenteroides]MCT0259538.1 glycosyltransferase family 2 protein [Weissella paramesenteroides]